LKCGHWIDYGSILNAYREGDLNFGQAVEQLEKVSKKLGPFVIESLKGDIESSEESIAWMSRQLADLVKEKGDPKKIDQLERWIAEQTQKIIECRAALK
jgi:hypothetical protein